MKFLARITALFPITGRGTVITLDIPADSKVLVGEILELRKDGVPVGRFPMMGVHIPRCPSPTNSSHTFLIHHNEEAKTLIEFDLEVWQVES
jgi:hypothetical protein